MARILVIDDETNIRMMIRLALQHVGHEVDTAPDGPEGLEKFGTGIGWELVLLDQRMPGMEGLEVLREIRRRNPDARVIVITAFGTIDLAVDAMKAGATDFLRKPFTAEVLRGAVQAALAAESAGQTALEPPAPVTFALTTLNGYRIESHPGPGVKTGGEIRHAFTVRSPAGEARECSVLLPAYVVELVKAHTDREAMPGGDRFWQALCEEALANFVWQNSDFPPDGFLQVDDLNTGLRRWIDTVLSAG
jgi:CheY-like chemotaxis protein